ncbi:unnamed protein product [Leptosia nina]|uniref:UDP-glucuronosyltransferase n=1 Tax=Leptosia nina TaxID=320188 RepID=A0AAV1K5B5_9NEOP
MDQRTMNIILIYIAYCEAANILYIVPFPSKSHDIFFRPIGLELAKRGHNVTVITSFDVPNPPKNYHKIVIERKELWDLIGTGRPNVFETIKLKTHEMINAILWQGGLPFTKHILNSSQVQEFLSKDNTFDLVISETFVQEAMYTLAYKYNAPLVLVSAFGNCMRHNIAVGNPLQLATVLHEFISVENPSSFIGRLENLYVSLYEYFWWRFWYLKEQESIARAFIKNLPPSMPSLYEMHQDASLFLINSHFSFDSPMALLPNIIEIGGLHATPEAESIPKDIEKILDESINGVLYINFGTNVKSSELPPEKKNAFLNVFNRLNITVLWKFEDDINTKMIPNVVVRKWFPQRKILAHPNIKLFFGHGGIMSTQEAIVFGVPIIGVPIYGDQYNNLLITEEAGFGKILNYYDINEVNVETAVNEMLYNASYMRKAKEISRRATISMKMDENKMKKD